MVAFEECFSPDLYFCLFALLGVILTNLQNLMAAQVVRKLSAFHATRILISIYKNPSLVRPWSHASYLKPRCIPTARICQPPLYRQTGGPLLVYFSRQPVRYITSYSSQLKAVSTYPTWLGAMPWLEGVHLTSSVVCLLSIKLVFLLGLWNIIQTFVAQVSCGKHQECRVLLGGRRPLPSYSYPSHFRTANLVS
jgi:hypothetical protein